MRQKFGSGKWLGTILKEHISRDAEDEQLGKSPFKSQSFLAVGPAYTAEGGAIN